MKTYGLRLKIIIITFLSLLFTSLIVLITIRQISFNDIVKTQISFVDDRNLQTERKINSIFVEATTINSSILQTSGFLEILGDESLTYDEKSIIYNSALEDIGFKNNFSSIRIYDFNNNKFFRSGLKEDEIRDPSPIFRNEIKETTNKSFLLGHIEKDLNGTPYLIIGRKINSRHNQNLIGYSFFYIDITSLILQNNKDEVIIINDKGEMLYNKDLSKVNYEVPSKLIIKDKRYKKMQIDNNTVLVFNRKLLETNNQYKEFDLTLINVYPYKDVFRPIQTLNSFIIYISILIFILSVIISLFISKGLVGPLKQLTDKILLFNKKQIKADKKNQYSNDEIGDLEQAYDEMIERIVLLIADNTEKQEEKRKLELDALQMQINPHFLYNTLDAIAWTAKLKKETSIEQLVLSLAKFFRLSLHKGDKFISVSDEIELIKHFLEIELIRFPDKFDVIYEVDDEIKNYKVLKLILQPIVENAIKHGISQLERNGNIRIKAYKNEKGLIFEVIDDGIGFNVSKKSKGKLTGFGIKNVDSRIKLEYGNEYGVEISSRKESGTIVVLSVGFKD